MGGSWGGRVRVGGLVGVEWAGRGRGGGLQRVRHLQHLQRSKRRSSRSIRGYRHRQGRGPCYGQRALFTMHFTPGAGTIIFEGSYITH